MEFGTRCREKAALARGRLSRDEARFDFLMPSMRRLEEIVPRKRELLERFNATAAQFYCLLGALPPIMDQDPVNSSAEAPQPTSFGHYWRQGK